MKQPNGKPSDLNLTPGCLTGKTFLNAAQVLSLYLRGSLPFFSSLEINKNLSSELHNVGEQQLVPVSKCLRGISG